MSDPDIDPAEVSKQVMKVIEDFGKEMNEATKSMRTALNSMPEPLSDPKSGDRVEVMNTDGSRATGTIVDANKGTVETVVINGMPLDEYWAKEGIELSPTTGVISVELGNKVFDYPATFVEGASELTKINGITPEMAETLQAQGYPTLEHLRKADQSDLADLHGVGNAMAAKIKAKLSENVLKKSTEAHDSKECTECERKFNPNSTVPVDGDQGEIYCSIDCLNESYT